MTGPAPSLASQIDAITAFLAALSTPGIAGKWEGGERGRDGVITMPWFDYSEEALAFKRACYANGWVDFTFNWTQWGTEAKRHMDDADALATIDVDTARRLITAHLRADRFNEGHLASVIESGHIAAILRRLAAIRAALD